MTKQLDNITADVTDKQTTSSLSAEVHANTSLNDIKDLVTYKPARVCVEDQDGYIACGPIVGTPRPEIPVYKPAWPDTKEPPENLYPKSPVDKGLYFKLPMEKYPDGIEPLEPFLFEKPFKHDDFLNKGFENK